MREFLITLWSGARYVVKADRVRIEHPYLTLVLAPPPSITDPDPKGEVVALFEQRQVYLIVARDHLVAEEKGEPIVAPHMVRSESSDIPF